MGYLVEEKKQSQTIKSYISAIKKVLQEDNVTINDNRILLTSLTKACKLKNDKVRSRLPIQKGVLQIILRSADEYFSKEHQEFLRILYKALFSTTYFGMFCVGEVTTGLHPIMVKDVQIAENKKKILFVLRSSKTHGQHDHPQLIKITTTDKKYANKKEQFTGIFNYCPYDLLNQYIAIRPKFTSKRDPFFVFSDNTPVRPEHMRTNLKFLLRRNGFNQHFYNRHSLRAGRSVDLMRMNVSLDLIRKLGRWSSNSVYAYLRTH